MAIVCQGGKFQVMESKGRSGRQLGRDTTLGSLLSTILLSLFILNILEVTAGSRRKKPEFATVAGAQESISASLCSLAARYVK
jgi:hypothetical protein